MAIEQACAAINQLTPGTTTRPANQDPAGPAVTPAQRYTAIPADELRHAAKLLLELADTATPGPWERPLDVRHKNVVTAALPPGERGSYEDGQIPADFAGDPGMLGRYAGQRERVTVVSCDTLSLGGFARARSGRDLDYVACMHPAAGLALARWLSVMAERAERELDCVSLEEPCCAEPGPCSGHQGRWLCRYCSLLLGQDCQCGWDEALAVAREILRAAER